MFVDVLADVRYAVRSLARTPVWTAAVALTIAIGIGSNAAVNGFVRGLLTTDLPIFAIERVVTVFANDGAGAPRPLPFSTFAALKARSDLFESLAAIRESHQRMSIDGRATLISVASYSPDAPAILPIPSVRGITLGPGVRFANFPASVDPAGRTISIGGAPTPIAGTMPYWLEGLFRGRNVDVWMPIDQVADHERVWMIGRLRPGVSPATAQAAINGIETASQESIAVLPYTGQTPETASGMLRVGALLRIAAVAVFLIACANVAAFMLARSSARSRETAVRVAIGARRRQLLRQLLVDSAAIAVIGGAAGLLLASWMANLVPLMFFDQDAERLVFAPDGRGIVTTSVFCIVITMTCGLAPLFAIRDDEPSAILQREVAGPSNVMRRVSGGLILLQMSGCALLVISTGLLLQGFNAALDTQAGRGLGNPILITLEALPSPSPDDGRRYFAAALNEARSVTRVADTVWAARLPGLRPVWQWVRFDLPAEERREVSLPMLPLTQQRLESMQLPPVGGRLFGSYDERCQTMVLNEAAATSIFNGHPIGRLLHTSTGNPVEVIGVVRPLAARAADAPIAYGHPDSGVRSDTDAPLTMLAPPSAELDSGLIDINIVSPNFFDTMGLSRVAGELFDGQGCRIGVVNEEAAARYFAGNAVGGAVIDGNGRRTHIVGVVRSAALTSTQRLSEPTLYLPAGQDYLARMTMVLATPDSRSATLESLRQRLGTIPGGRPDRLVVTTLDDHLSKTALAAERIAATLVAIFAAIAVALASLGVYGLMAEAARCRQREFAMRLALGAQAWRVVRLVMGEGLRLMVIGAALGMLGSLLVARWMTTIVTAAAMPSLLLWLAAPAMLTGAVVIASVIPARRALSANLVSLMRDM